MHAGLHQGNLIIMGYIVCSKGHMKSDQWNACVPTDVLRMTIWQTPAGIVDEGGMVLEAWLNFGITLTAPPANGLMHVGYLQSHCLP